MYTKNAEGGNVKHGLSYLVVMSLMELYLKKGYNLYMDSFYTNLAFFRALLDRQTYACGTIKWTVVNFLNRSAQKTKCQRCDLYSKWWYFGSSWEVQKGCFCPFIFSCQFFMQRLLKCIPYLLVVIIISLMQKGFFFNVVKPDCISKYSQYVGGIEKYDQLL